MDQPAPKSRRRVWLFGGLAGGLALMTALVMLFVFNPATNGFYPRCTFHVVTGLDCPGCGGLRATHQLLHGEIAEAFRLNPLVVCLLPVALLAGLRVVLARWRKKPAAPRPAFAMWTLAVAVVAFGVLRNLPWRSWLG
jgi:hypothetical protein